MKKILLVMCVVALMAGSASALSLSQGDMFMHLTDGSTLWTTEFGALSPRAPSGVTPPSGFVADGTIVGDESRSVMNVDTFEYSTASDVILPDGVLTGLAYDLMVSNFTVGPDAYGQIIAEIEFSNPSDTHFAVLELYEDSTPEGTDEMHVFDPVSDGQAPLQWDIDGVGTNTYTNVNDAGDDATLWLKARAMPIFSNSNIVSLFTMNLTTGTAETSGLFLEIIGGSAAYMFGTGIGNIVGTGASYDLFSDYTAYNPTAVPTYQVLPASTGGWQLASTDPIHGYVIPEPATLTLLGFGIAGLGLARRRKKK